MKRIWGIGIVAALGAGAAIAACGSSGTSATGGQSTSGAGGSAPGTGGSASHTTGSGNTGSGGGLGFDAGFSDATMDGDACGSVALNTHVQPGNLVVVFDQSDSMQNQFTESDGGLGGHKWKVAEDAIVAALTPLTAIVNAGTIFLPTTSQCTVATIDASPQIPIEPGATFLTDFQGHFSAPGWTTLGGTPLKVALDNANLALPDPSPLMGKRAVVIITDGAPTCVTMQSAILGPVQAMFSRGIETYAVGLPGSTGAANLLNAIASAGGTGTYLSPADPAALQAALAQIATGTIDQCTITLDPPPANPALVQLVVTDSSHPNGYEIMMSDAGDGWSLSSDGTTATLLGDVCTKAKDGQYTSIKFVYGCPGGADVGPLP